MFSDTDGYAPAIRSARVGRLDFDGSGLVMIDRETGQTLAFERTLHGSADASSDQLGIFGYRDAETDYPVVVRRPPRTDSDTGADWVLDHGASAEQWLAAVGIKSDKAVWPPQEL